MWHTPQHPLASTSPALSSASTSSASTSSASTSSAPSSSAPSSSASSSPALSSTPKRPLPWQWAKVCIVAFGLLWLGVACGSPPEPYLWELPTGTAPPLSPQDNPLNLAKVVLGRRLFYDVRLSISRKTSCGTCHQQALGFTDGQALSIGATGEKTLRSAMSLANVGYRKALTWANPLLRQLEQQILVPMFSETPVELGLSGQEKQIMARLSEDQIYPKLFADAFPEAMEAISLATIVRAIAAFCRTLVSRDTPYDRYLRGDKTALDPQAQEGMALFFSPRLSCFRCHGGIDLNAPHDAQNRPVPEPLYVNTGLYNLDDRGSYPKDGWGLLESTHRPTDMGKFRAPTLRNIAKTAPYMHDGSIPTLEGVLAHYAAGGREITTGPHAGDGRLNPWKSPLVKGFTLSEQEREALLSFLGALTDQAFLHNPAHADPFRD